MDSKQIRFLLDQYFEGKTTRKEELLLQRFYIENQNLDTDLEKFRALFLYYNQAKKEVFQKPPSRIKFLTGYAVAACLLVLVGLFITKKTDLIAREEPVYQATVEKAYNEFKTNFSQLSKHWEKGTSSVHYLGYWDQTTKELLKE